MKRLLLVDDDARLTFLKAQCSPSVSMAAIDEIRHPGLAAARPPEPVPDLATPLELPPAEPAPAGPPADAVQVGMDGPRAQAGAGLLADAPAICADLGQLFEALAREQGTGPERQDRLEDLFCKVHFLAAAAVESQFAVLAQTTALFDALLRVLVENPERLGPSVLRTVGSLVDVVRLLFQHASELALSAPLAGRVLVVDSDPLANQLVVAALGPAELNACGTEDSVVAWQWLNLEHFDLVLSDIEMPVLDGLELCQRLRAVPGYEKIPVLFLAAHADLETRATSALCGADELIAKPILSQELAAKVVMHLVRRRMQV